MKEPQFEPIINNNTASYELHEATAIYQSFIFEDDHLQSDSAFSASYFLSEAQKIILTSAFFLSIILLCVAPSVACRLFFILVNGCYILSAALRIYLFVIGKKLRGTATKETHVLQDVELPTYSIILPLHQEKNVLSQLIGHINAIDYPKHLLKVYLVLENEDTETIAALNLITIPDHFKVVYVPMSHPQTKPKACNYALNFIRSEFLVIYDAEDIPDPMQLRKVAAEFRKRGTEIDCVQCQLSFYNNNENWLCAMFSLEYKILFEYVLVALDHLDMPIPLGGTSNHLRVSKLRQLGGWDPFNVTEDAELGIRLSRNHMKTCVIPSPTHEEAPTELYIWIKQRTRWIKGYMQTYTAHTRQPKDFINKVGVKEFCLWTLLMFVPIISFVTLPLTVITALFVPSDLIATLAVMVAANIASLLYCSYHAKPPTYAQRSKAVDRWWWSYPLYFVLHSVAALRAVQQLFIALHLWEKTPHGLSKTPLP